MDSFYSSFFVWGQRGIQNSNIFEKSRPSALGFQIPGLRLGLHLLVFSPSLPLWEFFSNHVFKFYRLQELFINLHFTFLYKYLIQYQSRSTEGTLSLPPQCCGGQYMDTLSQAQSHTILRTLNMLKFQKSQNILSQVDFYWFL